MKQEKKLIKTIDDITLYNQLVAKCDIYSMSLAMNKSGGHSHSI